jgi:hypothetical protein
MHNFIPDRFYDQNIFQIKDILDEKRKMRDAEYTLDVDKRKPDYQRLWAPPLPWDFETLMEHMINEVGVKGIGDVGRFLGGAWRSFEWD